VRSGRFATVVAANVVDVVPAPEVFLAEAHRVLRKGGQLVLTTPDPALGTRDEDALTHALTAAGFAVDEVVDGLPWVRSHGPRHHQLYVAQLVVARRL
jgi:2-polyprenyl-3-methyl-5-hydroxy-6-metoxy-1,4-benzoquinol methylase